jgi:hypothetical protein
MPSRLWHYCNNLQRYAITLPIEAEVAAAMQYAIGNKVNASRWNCSGGESKRTTDAEVVSTLASVVRFDSHL